MGRWYLLVCPAFAAGAILLLFGQHLTRIAALASSTLTVVDGTAFITFHRTPIPLPNTLAQLLTELTQCPAPTGWSANTSSCWLFPGRVPEKVVHHDDGSVTLSGGARPSPCPPSTSRS
ncbi:hypothetical protein OH809_38345 [Streptomyces sp. NBC_00873]|uniref:hypothetical protein n=1 Tax=unclassified Streptomyces TaxID=2593676 RepID=UPI00386A6B19|nr:hypothetical protein OH809_38345 [Streptomyces sp. NBC_00873]WTA42115.1 hypothetical protein OH821_05365 [Streptomyces sp. NBC_00842]